MTGDYRTFHAPGRVNIIGEHIDYNGGYVLPCATTMGTTAKIRQRDDKIARFTSENFATMVEIPLEKIAYNPDHDWANYPMGIVHTMQQDGFKLGGFEVNFAGNIPNGAGLSSSASIELVMAVALNAVFNLNYDMQTLVKLAQKSENNFCGVNCGIMDMFAVGMCKKDFAILLNCETLDHKHVPLNLSNHKIIIMDTKKRRQLNESKYNERRAECEQALKILRETQELNHLADLTPKAYAAKQHLLTNEKIRNRAKHVIEENHRVKQAVTALEAGDIATLGELLTQSHTSLRNDYEVSCHELDTIVNYALNHPACKGARMTGAGFGGCAIALVEEIAIPQFIEEVSTSYEKSTSLTPAMHICESGDGAREISLNFAIDAKK